MFHYLLKGYRMTIAESNFIKSLPRTTDDMIQHNGQHYYQWASERVDAINTPERFSRCYDAAEEVADGSTHGEVIDDMREYAGEIYSDFEREAESMGDDEAESLSISEAVEAARVLLMADLDRLEQWHIDNGSYDRQIG